LRRILSCIRPSVSNPALSICLGTMPNGVRASTTLLLAASNMLQEGIAVKLTGLKRKAQATHPGHGPYHVTRLHRYDHEGLESFLEEEAKWAQSAKAPAAATAMIQLDDDEERPLEDNFLRLSPAQVNGLREHHAYLQSHQDTRTLVNNTFRSGLSAEGLVFTDMVSNMSLGPSDIRRKVRSDRHPGLHEGYAATGLWSLSSQYVGPIGVGTIIEPASCILDTSRPLEFMEKWKSNELMRNKSFLERRPKCHITDQSQVWVVYDTGSTNIWISSDLCKDGPCSMEGRHRYNHTVSSTFDSPQSLVQLTVQFGTGKIRGPQAIDDFHIGPFTVYNQTFAMIETEQGSVFEDVPFEGIVGLAYPAMSANGAKPFFDSVVEQGALKQNEFAFYFSRDKPASNAVFWGGVDPTFYKGDIAYFPVVDPYYWSLKLKFFRIGDEEILGQNDVPGRGPAFLQTNDAERSKEEPWEGPYAIVDTGTTFFTAESGKYQRVMDMLPAAKCLEITDKSHPPLTFRLETASGEDKDFILSNRQYMTASGQGDDAMCTTAFMQIDIPPKHGPAMVLGEVFMRHFFTVFDRQDGAVENGRVGIAEASHEPDTEAKLKLLTKNQPAWTGGAAAKRVDAEY